MLEDSKRPGQSWIGKNHAFFCESLLIMERPWYGQLDGSSPDDGIYASGGLLAAGI